MTCKVVCRVRYDHVYSPIALGCNGVGSPHPKCDILRIMQSRIAERLEQTRSEHLFEHARTDSLVSVSSDKDDLNLIPLGG